MIIWLHDGDARSPVEYWMCVEKGINKTTPSKAHAAKFDNGLAPIALKQVRSLYPSKTCGLMHDGETWLIEKFMPELAQQATGVDRERLSVRSELGEQPKRLKAIAEATGIDSRDVRYALRTLQGAGYAALSGRKWIAASQ